MKKYKLVALIPARKGSERIKNKNIVNLFGKPLIAHAIKSAKKTNLFDKIIVSTDSIKYGKIAKKYGAEVPFYRPIKISKSKSNDYEWVRFTLDKLKQLGFGYTHFFILRPTNPFRTSSTILRAWKKFKKTKNAESLRAIRECKEHPGKMWLEKKGSLTPLIRKKINNQPMHNMQFKALPKVLIQNASLEISNVEVIYKYKTITGKKIIPFYTIDNEGFDINHPQDILLAKYLKKNN